MKPVILVIRCCGYKNVDLAKQTLEDLKISHIPIEYISVIAFVECAIPVFEE